MLLNVGKASLPPTATCLTAGLIFAGLASPANAAEIPVDVLRVVIHRIEGIEANRMMGISSFRRLTILVLASSVLVTLTGCGDPMSPGVADDPKLIAARFVYYIEMNKPEDARALTFSVEDRPTTLEYGNREQLRQWAGMKAGCVLGESWETRVSVVEQVDNFQVAVPLRCGKQDDTTTLTVTKIGNEWGKQWVLLD